VRSQRKRCEDQIYLVISLNSNFSFHFSCQNFSFHFSIWKWLWSYPVLHHNKITYTRKPQLFHQGMQISYELIRKNREPVFPHTKEQRVDIDTWWQKCSNSRFKKRVHVILSEIATSKGTNSTWTTCFIFLVTHDWL